MDDDLTKENAAPGRDAAKGYREDHAKIKSIIGSSHTPTEASTPFGASEADWTLLELFAGIGEDLLPVVSDPSVKISPHSSMKATGKTPSRINTSGEAVGFPKWTSHRSTPEEITKWAADSRLGICIQTREVRALDVDVTDPTQAAEIEALIEEHIGQHRRRGRSNSAKFLVAFRLPGEFIKRVIKTAHGQVEFQATGQQFIAVGTHPSGARYEWQGGTPDDFETVSAEKFEQLWTDLADRFATETPSESRAAAGAIGPYVPGDDPIAEYLWAHDHVISEGSNGKLNIICPFEEEHTSDTGESSTIYMHKTADGRSGIFKCLHGHCDGRLQEEYQLKIGFTDAQIDAAMAEARRQEQIEENQRIGHGGEELSFAKRISLLEAEARFVFVASGKRVVDRLNPRHDLALTDWEAKFAGSVEELTQKETVKPDGSRFTPRAKPVAVSRLWLGSAKRFTVDQRTFKAGGAEFCYDPDGRWSINSWKPATRHEVTRRDMQIILQWFGIKDLKTWQAMNLDEKRAFHEQFARGTEAYFFEGKAPSLELQGVFSRFRAWLVHLYKTLFALDVELSDEVRGVFDRLLASDKHIAEATQIRGGRPIFTTKPASMTEMEWLQYQSMGADATDTALATYQARRLKDLAAMRTKVGRTAYKAMHIQVEQEVAKRPLYAVQTYLKTGTLPNGATAGDPVKLSIPAMKQLFGDGVEAPWRQLSTGAKGMASQSGVHPDIVAEQFGFTSGDAMIREIVAAPTLADAVKTETQQRFAEEYGDSFTAEGINTAVLDELSNEGRAQQLVAELNVLRRTTGATQMVYKAAKEHAARTVSGMPVKRARNATMHTAAEARAARAAENAFAAGDLKTAAEAKRDQVLNNQLARAAKHAREEVQDAIDRTRAYFKADSTLGKLRDMDLVNGARAILAAHGLGTASKSAAAYAESIRKNDPETWADIEPMVSEALANPKDYRDMTLDDFRGMIETVETLWHLSRRTRQIEIDGQLLDREEVVGQLTEMIRLKGQPYLNLGYDQAITKWQENKFGLLGVRAALRRVESWVSAMDGNQSGAFRRYIWQPISESVDAYREDKTKHLKQYLKLVEGLTIPTGKIDAPELGYAFNNKAELLHAILHTGNESNLSKLLRGRNWGQYQEDGTVDASAWKRFIWRASQDGILQKSDFDFAQGVWDLLESMKPAAQKAHRDMYGFYFNEISAHPVETPFGTYRGGYVPAIVDSRIVTDAAMRNEQENVLSGNNSFMFPTTGRGFTKGRVEGYAKPLLLDLGFLPSHIDKVLRFSYIEPHIKDVARIVKNSRGFGQAMDALDPTARTDMLIPWLQRTATQRVETPTQGRGGRAADKFFHALRTRTGLNIMTANVVNTLQQVTGLSTALLKVKPHFMRNALWQYVKQPKQTAATVSEKSTFMAHRVTAQAMEVQQHIDDLLLDPTKYEKAKAFARKHGYFMQAAAQNVVDLITWSGAYEQAVQRGTTEADAVRAADSAVRETQGSFSPEDVSRFESGTPFVRAFTMFYSYFNMQANLLGTEFATTAQEMGLRKGAGRLFYVYLFGVVIPAVLAEAIVRGASGDGFDDDEDGDVDLWDILSITLGAQGRFLMGMIPAAGPAVMAGINAFNNKWYDDRISTSPVVSSIESAVRAPHSIYKAMAEDGSTKRAVRDTLTAVGLMTGLPVAPLARPLGYLADVEEGKARADNPVDITRGLVTGRASKD